LEKKVGSAVKVTYVPVTADDRFSALTENRIDILCGSTTQTLARREMVDFTLVTFATGASLMSLKSASLLDFPSLEGKRVGVVKNTTTIGALRATLKKSATSATVVEVETAREGLEKLRNGAIDAFSADQVVLIGLAISAEDAANFTISSGVFSFEPFALAVRRNDADFRLVADRTITNLYRTKEILTIYEKWMGRFASQRPPAFDAIIELNVIPEG
jgi:ABC-type amino acid transport substrate-binding protein